jgi:hypothetical protein
MGRQITGYLGDSVEVAGVAVKIAAVDQHSEGDAKPRMRITLELADEPQAIEQTKEPKRRIGMPKR